MNTDTHTTAVTDETFDQDVLQADKPVLVDFWAEWCGPCRAVAPVVEEIAGTYADKIKVVKVDTDANPGVSARFGITSIPALYVFDKGEVVKTIVGARPKPVLVRELGDYLN